MRPTRAVRVNRTGLLADTWMMSVPVYRGRFGPKQAERLLWRAGFGPRPGEASRLARRGLRAAVRSLTRPKGAPRLRGAAPRDDNGLPLAPGDAWGHDHLWWLDRMARTDQPLRERMALVWHDWFATGDVGQGRLNIDQYLLLRRRWLASFRDLLADVTVDPAMLIWLSGIDNTKWAPNENYGREMMELFTLGADAGYTEQDVREQARALTGWTAEWDEASGQLVRFHFDPELHDAGTKTVLGRSGRFDWRDSCTLCLEHPRHASFLVRKLWSYFIPGEPPGATERALIALYKRRGHAIRPLVEAILMHPRLYEGQRLVKPPVVYIAGMLRSRRLPIRGEALTWVADLCGQRLFDPPNVAGWDEERWLDTASLRGRWIGAAEVAGSDQLDPEAPYDPRDETPKQAVRRARRFWDSPALSRATRRELQAFARSVDGVIGDDWQRETYRALRQNALRILIATSPDYQTS